MNILTKSVLNYDAGKVLKDQSMNDPSAHCFYYSSLLLLKHVLNHQLDYSYANQDTVFRNSHKNLKEEFRRRVRNNRRLCNILNQNLDELKRLRKKADYSADSISPDDITAAEACSTTINKQLESYFII
ncbi:MAG: hypothetical protein ACRCX4_12030 [Bacteroidales bacterium]